MKLSSVVFFNIVALCSITSLRATKTFISRAGTGGFTFDFNANNAVISGPGLGQASFFAGRSAATTTDATAAPFAIAGALESGPVFVPMAPETVMLNGLQGEVNPLYGQQISLLDVYHGMPLAVRADDPTRLYWVGSPVDAPMIRVYSSEAVKDAQGASGSDGSVTAGIVQITAGAYAFGAVKKNGGDFGDVGGGVAVCQILNTGIEQKAAVSGDTGIKAAPLDVTSSSIKIGSNAASLSDSIIDMHWDDSLQRLYVTFQATGGDSDSDGVRGIVVGYVNGGVLTFYPFAPADAFTGTSYIVGGVGEATVTTIYKLRTMFTSTTANYGIVLGNADDPETAQTTVYAVPLVNKNLSGSGGSVSDPTQGTLASKIVDVGTNLKTFYTTTNGVSYFKSRGFQVAASDTADLTENTDQAALVGGGVTPGPVTDMAVYKDAVFVSTGDDVTTQSAGIFYSQAVFDATGAIAAWTPWQRCYTSNDPSYGIFKIGYQGNYGQFFTAEGASSSAVKTFKTTQFVNSSGDGILGGTSANSASGLIGLVETTFATIPAGIQMVDVFPSNCPAFSQTTNQKLSVMTFSGYQQLVIAQTGSQADGTFTPSIGDFSAGKRVFTNGAINVAPAGTTQFIAVSGGALNTIGSINSTTMLNDGNYGYLVVGGVGGVAVLKNNSGQGWPTAGLQKFFATLGSDKSFQLVGNYKDVRKVWADGTNLYILTATQIDRIPAGQLAQAAPAAYTVATLASLRLPAHASFSDLITSGKLAFLATSYGLYRTANGANFSTATEALASLWTPIALADAPHSVTRFHAVSTTGLPYDLATQEGGGNLYVLAAAVATGLSATYRLAISDVSSDPITDDTVQLFPDYIIQDSNTGFVQWGDYRNYMTTDGSRVYVQRAAYLGQLPLIEDAPVATSGAGYRQRLRHTLPFKLTGFSALTPLVRTETGSMLVAGNNGLQVLE